MLVEASVSMFGNLANLFAPLWKSCCGEVVCFNVAGASNILVACSKLNFTLAAATSNDRRKVVCLCNAN